MADSHIKCYHSADTRNRYAAQQHNASLFRTLFLHLNFRGFFLGIRVFFFFGLIDKINSTNQIHIIFVHQRRELGKLHEIGSFEKHFQVIDRLFIFFLQATVR